MENSSKPYRGSCLCGQVKYEVDQIEPAMGHCHCSMCRKFHGAAFATLGEARSENFRWTSGHNIIKRYRADNGTTRSFCANCGSSLTFAVSGDSGELVEFSMGTLDSPVDERPDAHIFVHSKANWYAVADDLPQYGESRHAGRIGDDES